MEHDATETSAAPTARESTEATPRITPPRPLPRRVAEYGLPAQRLEDGSAAPSNAAGAEGRREDPLARPRTPWGTLRNILSNRVSGATTGNAPRSAPPTDAPSPRAEEITPPAASPRSTSGAVPDEPLAASPSVSRTPSAPPANGPAPLASSGADAIAGAPTGSAEASSAPRMADAVAPSAGAAGVGTAAGGVGAGSAAAAAAGAPGAGAGAASDPSESLAAASPPAPVQRIADGGAPLLDHEPALRAVETAEGGAADAAGAAPDALAGTADVGVASPGATATFAPARGFPGPGVLGRALRDGMRARQSASAPQMVNLDALSGLAVRGAVAPSGEASATNGRADGETTARATRPDAGRASGVTSSGTTSADRAAASARARAAEVSAPSGRARSGGAAASAPVQRIASGRDAAEPSRVRPAGGAPSAPGAPTAPAPLQRIAAARSAASNLPRVGSTDRVASAGATGLHATARRDLGTAAMVARARSSAHIARMFTTGTARLGGTSLSGVPVPAPSAARVSMRSSLATGGTANVAARPTLGTIDGTFGSTAARFGRGPRPAAGERAEARVAHAEAGVRSAISSPRGRNAVPAVQRLARSSAPGALGSALRAAASPAAVGDSPEDESPASAMRSRVSRGVVGTSQRETSPAPGSAVSAAPGATTGSAPRTASTDRAETAPLGARFVSSGSGTGAVQRLSVAAGKSSATGRAVAVSAGFRGTSEFARRAGGLAGIFVGAPASLVRGSAPPEVVSASPLATLHARAEARGSAPDHGAPRSASVSPPRTSASTRGIAAASRTRVAQRLAADSASRSRGVSSRSADRAAAGLGGARAISTSSARPGIHDTSGAAVPRRETGVRAGRTPRPVDVTGVRRGSSVARDASSGAAVHSDASALALPRSTAPGLGVGASRVGAGVALGAAAGRRPTSSGVLAPTASSHRSVASSASHGSARAGFSGTAAAGAVQRLGAGPRAQRARSVQDAAPRVRPQTAGRADSRTGTRSMSIAQSGQAAAGPRETDRASSGIAGGFGSLSEAEGARSALPHAHRPLATSVASRVEHRGGISSSAGALPVVNGPWGTRSASGSLAGSRGLRASGGAEGGTHSALGLPVQRLTAHIGRRGTGRSSYTPAPGAVRASAARSGTTRPASASLSAPLAARADERGTSVAPRAEVAGRSAGRTGVAQRIALPRGSRALPSISAPPVTETASSTGMRILDTPTGAPARVEGQTGDLPVAGTLTAEAALRAVAAAADFRRERGDETAPTQPPARPASPSSGSAATSTASAAASATAMSRTASDGPASDAGRTGAAPARIIQRLARRARTGLPRASGPSSTVSVGALPPAGSGAAMPGILSARGGRPDVTSLPVGASGAAGAVSAARRAAADVVRTALSGVGLEADESGAMRLGSGARASGGESGSSEAGSSWHASDATYVAPSATPVQRAIEDGEQAQRESQSAAEVQERVSELMDALEARILAQIERRGGRYRGMFS